MMKKSFWYNSDQNGDLLKPRTGHGQYVVDIDNMLFAISGLSNCTVSTYRVFLQCTMCTLFSVMPLYLLWHCIQFNQKKGGYRGIFREAGEDTGTYFREITDLEFQNHKNVKKCTFRTLEQVGTNICSIGYQNSNFKIGLSLFGCAEECIEQSTHCALDL